MLAPTTSVCAEVCAATSVCAGNPHSIGYHGFHSGINSCMGREFTGPACMESVHQHFLKRAGCLIE